MNLIALGEKYFDEVEISKYRRREVDISVELNRISMASSSERSITVVRGIKDKRMGICVVEGDDHAIEDAILRAYKMARVNDRDERWESLPTKQRYREATKVDESLKEIGSDFFVNLLLRAIENIRREDENAVVAGGSSGSMWIESNVENSHGVDISQRYGATYFYLYLIGRKGEQVTPGIFDIDARRDTNLQWEFVVDRLLRKLEKAYNVVKAEKGESRVIFEPFALGELLEFTLIPSIKGERKVKGTSYLQDKLNDRVVSEKLTIEDDPLHPMSIVNIIADDEGVATQKSTIFENGVFKGFLWDNYWGKIEGIDSTGNGYRSFKTGGIEIAPHNLVIKEGNIPVEDMIGDIEDGYLVSLLQGAHSSNPATGDFNVVANPAFRIQDGEISGSTVFMMSGNVYDLLGRVERISKEQRMIYAMGKGVYPHIEFTDVKIAPVNR